MSAPANTAVYLYDAKGQAYRFESADEIADRKIPLGDAPGIAAGQETAPSDWEARAKSAEAAVQGRHTIGGYYHVYWAYGVVYSADVGAYIYCLHRHLGPYNPWCYIDYSGGWRYA